MSGETVAAQFSYKAGRKTVSQWETGRSIPTALVLKTLCRLYNCSAESLLWDSQAEAPGPVATLPAEILDRIAALSSDQRAALVRNIESSLDLLAPAAPPAPATKPRFAA